MLRVLVLKLAAVTPLLVDSAPIPSVRSPSLKVTEPLGGPIAVLPGELTLTVAVKVTVCPEAEGLTELLSPVVVAAVTTVRVPVT